MFKSKQKPLKNLTISTPLANNLNSNDLNPIPRSTPDQQVILVSKFDFKAENKNEISIGVGEALKLIERKGNGWILVKPIGRLGDAGLIPSTYVKIVKLGKDKFDNIIDEDWLSLKDEVYENSITSDNLASAKHPSLNSSISSNSENNFSFTKPSTPNSSFIIDEALPESGLVRNASCHNGRYWYRVDIVMNDGKKRHLCRYYQDFYKLHCSIIEKLKSANETEENIQKLPNLPDPIPRPDLQTLSNILLQRCQVLNIYIFRIVQNKYKLDYSKILNEWIQPRLGDIEASQKEVYTNERIEELLRPLPTKTSHTSISSTSTDSRPNSNILNLKLTKSPSLSVSTSATPPLPAPSAKNSNSNSSLPSPINSPVIWQSPTLSQSPNWTNKERSFSTPNVYQRSSPKQQFFNLPTDPLSYKRESNEFRTRSRNCSTPSIPTVHEQQEFTSSSCSSSSSLNLNNDFYKVKIFANDDIFALKIKKDSTLDTIKQSILTRLECDVNFTFIKLYYKNLFTGHFVPLINELDLNAALNQAKISFKVHVFANDAVMI